VLLCVPQLVAFPYDRLSCDLEFGGWILSGEQQGIQFDGTGYSFSSQESSSGSSYQESTIDTVNVRYAFYSYDCCPSEPWPVVLYRITLKRAGGFYTYVLVIPGVLIVMLSFAVFWSDTQAADALSYGVTVIVVNLLLSVVLIGMLPVCGEVLWVDMFSMTNTFFCCISLFESALTIMLENHDGEHLVYTFIAVGFKKVFQLCNNKAESEHESNQIAVAREVVESVAGVLYRQKEGTKPEPAARPAPVEVRMRKLVCFESLFRKIDLDSNQFVELEGAGMPINTALTPVSSG
jgi:hypothetical protein